MVTLAMTSIIMSPITNPVSGSMALGDPITASAPIAAGTGMGPEVVIITTMPVRGAMAAAITQHQRDGRRHPYHRHRAAMHLAGGQMAGHGRMAATRDNI